MIKQMLTMGLALLLSVGAYAQDQDYTKVADSDPAARKILNQVRQKYEAYSTIEANFALELEFPEQPKEVQKGTLARNGDQYRVEFGNQEFFSDGKAMYLVMHNNESVQINNMPEPGEDTGLISPQTIFNFYDNGEFIYSLIDTRTENGKAVHIIEFKPSDRTSEYAKLRMVVARDSKEIIRVKAFAKDGSRFTFQLTNVNANKQFASNHFGFDKSKYPDYYVEDLRY